MKLCERIYLVGSGQLGLSDTGDSHVYLIDGEQELALDDLRVLRHIDRVMRDGKVVASDGVVLQ